LLVVAWLLLDVLCLNGSNEQEKVVIVFPPFKVQKGCHCHCHFRCQKERDKETGDKAVIFAWLFFFKADNNSEFRSEQSCCSMKAFTVENVLPQ
jgi:hypothetical protein